MLVAGEKRRPTPEKTASLVGLAADPTAQENTDHPRSHDIDCGHLPPFLDWTSPNSESTLCLTDS